MILQTNSTSTSYTFQVPAIVPGILAALPYTIVYAVGNYIDSHLNKGEAFNGKMFLKTFVIACAMAALIAYLGLNPATNAAFAFLFITGNAVFMSQLDNLVNKIWSLAGEIHVTVQTPAPSQPKTS
jgi:small basic protein